MTHCMVLWCENKGQIPGVSYFKLIKSRHDAWMEALGRNPNIEHLSPSNVVCSEHFTEENKIYTNKTLRLKSNAVPTLKLRKRDKNCRNLNRSRCKKILLKHVKGDNSIKTEEKSNLDRFSPFVGNLETIQNEIEDDKPIQKTCLSNGYERKDILEQEHNYGHHNPELLKYKIKDQQKRIKLMNQNNQIICNNIKLRVSLGPKLKYSSKKGLRITPLPPIADYPGFQEMLNQSIEQQLENKLLITNIFGSVSQALLKSYDHVFKEWLKYCSENNVHIFKPSLPEVLIFFKTLIKRRTISFRTLMKNKTAIFRILDKEIVSHTRLKSFFKEISDLHSKRQFSFTWNPHVLLLHLSKQFPNEKLGLDCLIKKVVMLLALTTNVRLQSLIHLNLEDVIITNNEVQISFPDYVTSTICRNKRTSYNFQFFNETPQLCVASALCHYIERSLKIKSTEKGFLFFDIKGPHNPTSSSTLTTWIRRTIEDAGVDITLFSHSKTNLETLTDHKNELLFDEIRRTAEWTDNVLIFTNFYGIT